jgi:hypothetical protein
MNKYSRDLKIKKTVDPLRQAGEMDTDGAFHNTGGLVIKSGPLSRNQYAIREHVMLSWRQAVMAVGRTVHRNRLATRSSCSGAHYG